MTRPRLATVDAVVAKHGDVQVLPMSFAQRRFWILDQIDGAGAYTIPLALRLSGALDVTALRRALDVIVERHEALRTVFAMDGDDPVQVVIPRVTLELPVETLEHVAAAERDAIVCERATENANASFDLGEGPLVRASLLRLAADEHVLLIALHHVIADGWSVGVLFDELSAAYTALRSGAEPTLGALPLQYADYAVWQRRVVDGAKGQQQLAYWTDRLRGVPVLELETDHVRPVEQTASGGKRELLIGRATSEGMRALARREHATAYMAFLTAYVVLLHRYTAQTDIVVGSITSGRLRPEVESLIGLFVNTLAIRTDVAGDPSFAELLQRVRARASEAYANQDVPFEQVVDAVQPTRDRSRSPIFQAAFQLLEGLAGELSLPGLVVTRVAGVKDTTKFELTLMLHPSPDGGLRAVIEYNSDLFDSTTADRMLEHYAVLLGGIVSDPTCNISTLPIMSEGERARLLVERNATFVPVPDAMLHELVFEQCARTPDAIAVEADADFDGTMLTFAELSTRARRLSAALGASGVRRGDAVGIALDRSCELMVALVGTLATGAQYVPLDLELPEARLRAMIDESRPAAILTTADAMARVRQLAPGANVLSVEDLLSASHAASTDSASNVAATAGEARDSSDLAYTIYTSGSTGRPKGVMVSHRAVVNYLCWMRGTYACTVGDAILQKAPIGFDASVWELFLPLVTGARLVLARPGGHRDPAYLADVVRRRGITILQLVPSQLTMMLEDGALTNCAQLRRIVCGGEALPATTLVMLLRTMPDVAVTNLYGPTETTVYSTHWEVDRTTFDGTVSIGSPIWNTSVYVVDAAMQPVPTGVPGELFIGGRGVARGYAGSPNLTRERFVPLALAGDAVVYRTGDRVRWRGDGTLEYLGRTDTQIKLRGHRIELGEIESALSSHPAVGSAVAVVRDDAAGGQQLVAYVTPSGADAPDRAALRAGMRAHLPEYMIPSAIVVLAALPLNANGKLDRRALPAPDADAQYTSAPTLPRTPLEEQIAAIWRDVLGRDVVGVDDDFFALGGHSLLAMRVVARLAQTPDAARSLTIGSVFRTRTIARLAEHLEAQTDSRKVATRDDRAGDDAPQTATDTKSVPLSRPQELLWLYEQAAPGSGAYNVPVARRVRGPVDVRALDAAFTAVIAAHESLRTTFTEMDGTPRQIVGAPWAARTEVLDLQDTPASDREALALAKMRDLASSRMNVERGPLMRVHLLRLAPDDAILLIVVHHLVFDGASIPVLLRAVAKAYATFLQDGVASCAPPAHQFAELVWRERIDNADTEGATAFWRDYLRGSATTIDLPLDRPRDSDNLSGARVAVTLAPDVRDAVVESARNLAVTPFIVLLAAFDVLLHRYSAQSDIVVGTPLAGRASADADGVIGHLTTTLPIRAQLEGAMRFSDVVRRIALDMAQVHSHPIVPFASLERNSVDGRDTALFDVLFNVQDGAAPEIHLGAAVLEPIGVELSAAKLPLSISVALVPAGIRVVAEFRSALFREDTVARMIRSFSTLLENATAAADCAIGEIAMLTTDDRETLVRLATEGATAAAEPADPVPDMILAQCARTPDSIALVSTASGGQRVQTTYGELAEQSAVLAAQLVSLGVSPGDAVAVCVERCASLVVALLASWRAGAHYVPIDPEYPADRIAFMLRDSDARAIVTSPSTLSRLPDAIGDAAMQHVIVLAPDAASPDVHWSGDVVRAQNSLAYVIYTSGSTGQPKGVMVSHESLANLARSIACEPGISSRDTLAAVTTISFDIAALELWVPLCVGGTVVVATRDEAADGERLAALLHRERVTVLQATPVTWRLLLAAGWEGNPQLTMLCGGEALSADLAAALRSRGRVLWNMYGPTETTIWSALSPIRDDAPISLGRPVADTQLFVVERRVDGNDFVPQLSPLGVPGELLIGGAGVARGYHNRPDLTASRFIPDSFTQSPERRLYRTGDLVRRHADGRLEFLGRLDNQIKLRGFRIELGEIEAAARGVPGVRDAAVALHDGVSGAASLTAYLCPEADAVVDRDVLRAHLTASLPVYMVPSYVVFLDQLPRTANGKLDRRALRPPLPSELLAPRAYVAPATDTERVIAALFAEVLGTDEPSVDTSFFQLGGHSLLATRVVALASRVFRRSITHRTLFEHPSISAFASALVGSEPVPGHTQRIAALFLKAQQSHVHSTFSQASSALAPA